MLAIPISVNAVDQLVENYTMPFYITRFTKVMAAMLIGPGSPEKILFDKASGIVNGVRTNRVCICLWGGLFSGRCGFATRQSPLVVIGCL